jgi:SAM-dependent methyltransferase
MKVTLEESFDRQHDHYLRCKRLAETGNVPQPWYEDKSYQTLYNAIPNKSEFTKVLDVGCQLGEAYRKCLHNLDYHAIEILPDIAHQAERLGVPNVTVGYMEELLIHYQPETFDVVWARHVLEHATDFNLVMGQIAQLLKLDGVLAFIVPCGYHNEPAHITQHTKEEWIDAIEFNDFEIITSWQHDFNLNEFGGIARRR